MSYFVFTNGVSSVITIGGAGGSRQGEKTNYGAETVESIECSRNVTLNGTTVEDSVSTEGRV